MLALQVSLAYARGLKSFLTKRIFEAKSGSAVFKKTCSVCKYQEISASTRKHRALYTNMLFSIQIGSAFSESIFIEIWRMLVVQKAHNRGSVMRPDSFVRRYRTFLLFVALALNVFSLTFVFRVHT